MATREKNQLLPGRVKRPENKLSNAGRPRKEMPPDAIEVVREATSRGASKLGTAMALGCSFEVLSRWLDESTELKQAFDEGREKERQTLHNVLYQAALNPDHKGGLVAAMFLLKCRHAGYNDSGSASEQGNRVSINFQIPGARPLTDFVTVENEPTNT